MTAIEVFQNWFAHERIGNQKMMEMLDSVSEEKRDLPDYKKASNLAAHLIACRVNWLNRIQANEEGIGDWWPKVESHTELEGSLSQMELAWSAFLSDLTDEEFNRDFEFVLGDGRRIRWNVRGQLMQMVGHAFYHRGQISLLVDTLGGVTVDTDYLYWVMTTDPNYGVINA